MRLAWFTPVPPVRSGVATYTLEVLPRLAAHHEVDVFVDQEIGSADLTSSVQPRAQRTLQDLGARVPDATRPSPCVLSAHEFVWRHARRPYDLAVYQMGNATCHEYMWAYAAHYPGLVVLHDTQLHHARARQLLQHQRHDEYRAEFRFNHPEVRPDVAELVIAGAAGAALYFWPMVRALVMSARLVAVHNARVARDLSESFPEAHIRAIRMGVAAGAYDKEHVIRERHRIDRDAIVFAALGRLTPEKRLSQALRALVSVVRQTPAARLMLVGEPVDYYDIQKEARELGIADRLTVTGYVDEAELSSCLEAVDVCLCLRWPTTRETSASWLRCLAVGKPTIVTDLVQTVDVPAFDPRTWTVLAASPAEPDPICVSIDILDEDHSLRLAMRRLACDGELRRQLGQRARAYWQRHHTLDVMVDDYLAAIAQAIALSAPPAPQFPAHLVADGARLARSLAGQLGVAVDVLRT